MTAEMTYTGSDLLVQALRDEGVDTMFGYPGGAIIPVFDTLYRKHFNTLLVRHEQGAAHAAEGYAKSTGRPGVLMVTSGPGATNAITGIADAQRDSVPMVVFTGQVGTGAIGHDAFQEVNVLDLMTPVTKHTYQFKTTEEIPAVIHEAFALAKGGRPGPVVIDMPKDLMTGTVNELPDAKPAPAPAPKQADQATVEQAAKAFAEAKRPLVVIGNGAVGAGAEQEVNTLVHKFQLPFATTLLGIAVVPSEDEFFLGMGGMHGSYAANQALEEADFVLGIGVRFEDRFATKPDKFTPKATLVQIDVDPNEKNRNVNADFALEGDARAVLNQFLGAVESTTPHQEWLDQVAAWNQERPFAYQDDEGSFAPEAVIKEIGRQTQGRAYVVTDVGQHQMWAAQFYPFTFPRQLITSGGFGTMGFGIPAAIGTQFAHRDDQVVLFTGDGSLQMTSEELDVASQYNLNLKVVLFNNQRLGMVRQWQDLFFAKRRAMTVLDHQPNFAKLADAYGFDYRDLDLNGDWQAQIARFLQKPGPGMLEVQVDPDHQAMPMIFPGNSNGELYDENYDN